MNVGRTSFFLGTLVGAATASIVLTGAQASGSASKVVFENDRVRVKDVMFAPGVLNTGMHTHDLPHVGVILTQGALVFTEPGNKPETVAFTAGSVGYREANVTHQVANPGKEPMRVIEVELK